MKKRTKPKAKKPRRVVLGVGHPWFLNPTIHGRTHICMSSKPNGDADVGLTFRDLGNWNRIRLVAEDVQLRAAGDGPTTHAMNLAEKLRKAEAALAAEKSSGDLLGRELIEARNELFAERERADKMTNECQLWMDTCRDAEERAERLESAHRRKA